MPPAISPATLKQIIHYAKFPQTGVSLRQMVQFGQSPSQGTLLRASQFLAGESTTRSRNLGFEGREIRGCASR
jgi:pyruvate dehydrogenase kinase 2/3/4